MHHDVSAFIVDPVALFREGLRLLLIRADVQVPWCGDTLPEPAQLDVPPGTTPMLIIGSCIGDAYDQIAAMRRTMPDLRVVLLVDTSKPGEMAEAMQWGADTVVPRDSSIESLISTLRLVCEGAAVFPRGFMTTLGTAPPRPEAVAILPEANDAGGRAALHSFGLSERETMVLMWLRDGLPNKEIARRMFISEATVKVHVKAILRKARMRNRTQVACWASRHPFMDSMRLPSAGAVPLDGAD